MTHGWPGSVIELGLEAIGFRSPIPKPRNGGQQEARSNLVLPVPAALSTVLPAEPKRARREPLARIAKAWSERMNRLGLQPALRSPRAATLAAPRHQYAGWAAAPKACPRHPIRTIGLGRCLPWAPRRRNEEATRGDRRARSPFRASRLTATFIAHATAAADDRIRPAGSSHPLALGGLISTRNHGRLLYKDPHAAFLDKHASGQS